MLFRSVNLDIALTELQKLLTTTNNLGWFPSLISSRKEHDHKEAKWSEENFKSFINQDFTEILFSFEAKFDIPVEKYPQYLYHVCKLSVVDKILKYGLSPKSRSKKVYHPDRVFLAKNLEHAYLIANYFKNDIDKDFAIIKVDTETIEDYLRLFKDPNFPEKGFYTLNHITPYCLFLEDTISF